MISERPSGAAGASSSGMGGGSALGGGGGGAGVSIGNYKGVMLCNRPFAGVAAAAHGARGGQAKKQPFRSAVVHQEPLGLNPTREHRSDQTSGRRKNKNSALSRHKKWLYQLQKAKEKYQQEAEEEAQRQENRRRKFAEQQAALRAQVRETLEDAVVAAEQELAAEQEQRKYEEKVAEPEQLIVEREQAEARREQERANLEDAEWFDVDEGKMGEPAQAPPQEAAEESKLGLTRQQQKKLQSKKPMWALTKEAKDQLEDEEADELLDFAQNLDFDKYLDDLEVRAALEAVQERIARIEVENETPEDDFAEKYDEGKADGDFDGGDEARFEGKYEESSVPPRAAKLTRKALSKHNGRAGGERTATLVVDKDDDAKSVRSAQSVLSEVKSLRGIHSARSLAQLAKQTAKEMGRSTNLGPILEESTAPFVPPKIVVVDETAGVRAEIKKQPGQLPYMHRNPAV